MKKVSIREFQLHASKYLKGLLIVLTQSKPGEVEEIVAGLKSVNTQKDTIKVSNVPKKIKKVVYKNGLCPHFVAESGYCRKCNQ